MNKSPIYRRILVGMASISVLVIIIATLSQVISYFSSGADELQAPKRNSPYYENLAEFEWMDGAFYEFGDFNPATKKDIERDYLVAWKILNEFRHSHDPEYLSDYFADDALKLLTNTFLDTSNLITHRIDLEHHIRPYLFSLDQQVFAFTDENVVTKTKVSSKSDAFSSENVTDTISMNVLMVLQDSRWKIQNFESIPNPPNSDLHQAAHKSSPWKIKEDSFLFDEIKFEPRGVNYYPQATPWLAFWENYQEEETKEDFAKINGLSLNTIRIFVPYEGFGKQDVQSESLSKLINLLDIAELNSIKVIITLFDFPHGYDYQIYNDNLKHLGSIVNAVKDHPALFAWDIKNEPNLDFKHYGQQVVLDWLTMIIERIKFLAPNNLVTIGWSDEQFASLMSSKLDFVSYHYFKNINDFEAGLVRLKRKINKPILVTEIGKSSSTKIFSDQEKQAAYLEDALAILNKHETGFVSWSFYDYNTLPSSIFGHNPYLNWVERHYGLLDKYGNEKLAAKVISGKIGPIASNHSGFIKLVLSFVLFTLLGLGLVQLFTIPKEFS